MNMPVPREKAKGKGGGKAGIDHTCPGESADLRAHPLERREHQSGEGEHQGGGGRRRERAGRGGKGGVLARSSRHLHPWPRYRPRLPGPGCPAQVHTLRIPPGPAHWQPGSGRGAPISPAASKQRQGEPRRGAGVHEEHSLPGSTVERLRAPGREGELRPAAGEPACQAQSSLLESKLRSAQHQVRHRLLHFKTTDRGKCNLSFIPTCV